MSHERHRRHLMSFSERSYARDTEHRYDDQRTSALVWLLCAMGAGFVLQNIFGSLINGGAGIPTQAAALVPAFFLKGYVWTLFTYIFLHANPLHLVINGIVIYFMGREVLPMLGNRRFYVLCAFAAVCGGLLWLAVNFHRAGYPLVGADSITYALFIFFVCLNPNARVRTMFFFIIPVTIVPKRLAIIIAVLFLCGLFLFEIPGRHVYLSLDYSAYLGGMLGGLAYYYPIYRRRWRNEDGGASSVLPEWLHKKKKPAVIAAPKYKVNITSRDDLKAEIDRILDKINSQGFASLTDEEKRTLDSAKDMMSGR